MMGRLMSTIHQVPFISPTKLRRRTYCTLLLPLLSAASPCPGGCFVLSSVPPLLLQTRRISSSSSYLGRLRGGGDADQPTTTRSMKSHHHQHHQDDGDAVAYNTYASAAVDLSNAHVSEAGLLTVTRSVRDIDNEKRRKFLYTIPLAIGASKKQDARPISSLSAIPPPSELPDDIQFRLPSPSGRVVAIFRSSRDSTEKSRADNKSNTVVLEIWKDHGQRLERRIDLASSHGKVITDASGGFGIPSWNADETVLVYTAERAPPKTVSFFDTASNNNDPDKKIDDNDQTGADVVVGGESVLGIGKSEHWGEKYANQSPLHDLYCVNIETGKVGRVENVPNGDTTTTTEGGYSLGQPIFHPVDSQSIVYTGWDAGGGLEMPRRLGLIYCQQRPCQIYHSSIRNLLKRLARSCDDSNTTTTTNDDRENDDGDEKDAPFTSLTAAHRLSHSPRFAPLGDDTKDSTTTSESSSSSSKLVFLTSVKGFDTHSGCLALASIDDLDSATGDAVQLSILVDQVWDPTCSSSSSSTDKNLRDAVGEVARLKFPGLFMMQLPVSCFLSPDYLLAMTQWGSCQKIVRISVKDGSVRLIQLGQRNSSSNMEYSSDEIMCTLPKGGGAIVNSKTPGQPATLHHVPFTEIFGSENTVNTELLATMPPIASSKLSPVVATSVPLKLSFDIRVIDAPVVKGVDFANPIQSILLLPDKSQHPNPPLIVVPHGGPHSVCSTIYLPSYAFLCEHGGYAVLLVNYRGSTGFGQGSIESLPTQIGTLDIQDVASATLSVKESGLVDPEKIGICGGSHGGFLTAHATSQHPDLFRAAVMRNPVVNIASMVTATDIPDWCYVEALGSYDWKKYMPPTQEQVLAMYNKSPIQYIDRVKTPTLVALGLKDLRVPPSQGLEWFHSLRSMGVPTKLLTYDGDDHSIDGVASEANHWIQIKRWFDEYLR